MTKTFLFNPVHEAGQSLIDSMLKERGITPLYKKVGTCKGIMMYQIRCITDKITLAEEVLFSEVNSVTYKTGSNPNDDNLMSIKFNGFSFH